MTAVRFVGETVSWASQQVGEVTLGVVDASVPGVAESISRLLVRSIEDARSDVGGHLPGWLVDDIRRNYISPEKVRTLWAAHGHRFALVARNEIIGTVHVARSHVVVLTADRTRNNVRAAELLGLAPPRHHQVVNVSIAHEHRHSGLAARMFDEVMTTFRDLFDGDGLWVRADPPWHPWLTRLGFVHDPAFDVFLPETVERTAGLPHAEFNRLHACACAGIDSPARIEAMGSKKLQYVSMTRAFDGRRTFVPTTADEVRRIIDRAAREGRTIAARGAGSGVATNADWLLSTRAFDRIVVDAHSVTVGAGVTWRALLSQLPPELLPPVVPGYLEATIGGSIATGGIGKGSALDGLVADHVEARVEVGGIILEATLPLVRRKPRVRVKKELVARANLVQALSVEAFHVFATQTAEGWLVVVGRESDDETNVPLRAFVTPERSPTLPGYRFQRQFVTAAELEGCLSTVAYEPGVTIHPVRRPTQGLLFAITIANASVQPALRV
jgi:hypothetical protein